MKSRLCASKASFFIKTSAYALFGPTNRQFCMLVFITLSFNICFIFIFRFPKEEDGITLKREDSTTLKAEYRSLLLGMPYSLFEKDIHIKARYLT